MMEQTAVSEFHFKLNRLMAQKDQAAPTAQAAAKIQRVPSFLRERECLKKYFEPMWISFGPIHYNNPKLEVSEKCKLQLVAKFIRDSGYSSHEVLYEEIKSDIIGLEQCYDEKVIRGFTNKETLYWILFFDGCAILQFLASSSSTDALKELKELKIKIDQETFINCDLLLLENQIPFRLLELLMDKSKIKDKLPELLNKFIRRNVMAPVKDQEEIFKAETKTNPAHLLDLFRLAFLPHPAAPDHQTNNAGETTRQPADDPDISSTSGSSNVTQPAHDPYISSTSGSAHDRRDCCELIIYSLKKYLLLPISWQNRARRTQSAAPVRRFHDEETPPVRNYINAEETTQQPGRRSDEIIPFNDEQMRVVSQSAAPVRNDINAEETTQQPVLSQSAAPVRNDINAEESTQQPVLSQSAACVRNDINAEETTQQPDKQKKAFEQQYFRSVQDLKASGINLKPSKTYLLNGIKFSSMGFSGELVLPPLIVDDLMAPKFMNLIAYEMCPDNMETKYEVTSYICFLDSLIDYAADVKELRKAEILHNLLGSDKQVAKLFNEIATDLVPNLKVYEEVIEKIEKHCKNKWMTWMAQVSNDHFSSPWTILAFLAAVLVLFMTAVQTWFTVYSPPGR